MAATGDLRLGMSMMPPGTPAFNNHTVDANNDGVGWAIQARDTAAITHLGFRYGARTGTPPVFVATLEGISATTGLPDGSDLGGGSPTAKTFTPPADATWDGTWQWIQLTNAYTPTSRGQIIVGTIRHSSGTIDASNLSTFTSHVSNGTLPSATFFPNSYRLTAGTWARQGHTPCVSLRTASTRYGYPIISEYNTRSASTVGHRQALKFTLPAGSGATKTVRGVRFVGSLTSGSGKNPILGLWNAGGALQTLTLDSEWGSLPTSANVNYELFFDEATLSALDFGTAYYIGMEVADAASGGVLINGIQLDNASDLDAYPGGADFHFATFDGSSWSDDTTVRPFVELILDDITEPAGGGGGIIYPRSLSGGLV
jgi:hypothetical protein